jgi:hypothetical protein
LIDGLPRRQLVWYIQQESKALTRVRSQIRVPAISSSRAGTACRFNGYDERCRLRVPANLSKANLSKANLSKANLSGANLSETLLTQEQFEKTTGDKNTRLRPGFNPPAHWGVKTDDQIEGN